MRSDIRDILMTVNKPYRSIGGEVGEVRKAWDASDVRICLGFPDVYEIGMSHTGLAILYDLVNAQEGMLAERVFAPWADMEAVLRERKVPLFSLESGNALSAFDILGISLAYELTATNVLNLLDLAGLPLRASHRHEGHPLVIAGGPCAFNPMPLSPFFDAIVIGDGEEALLTMAQVVREAKHQQRSRAEILARWREIDGVFVPTLPPTPSHPMRLARVLDLESAPYPTHPIAAYAATQERVAVEVARGCTRGCRFCQAGYVYRPLRQRSGTCAAHLAAAGVVASGKEEFSFLSLSVGDWAPLGTALADVHTRCGDLAVNATLPSLRVESLTQTVIDELGGARSGSFTLAPEAGTERMRAFINKGNTDADLFASVEKIFASGWHAIKLYFMVGLPGETAEELDAIVRIANTCLDIGRKHHRRPDVTVSTSTFIPKPHTPFQWERQIGIAETERLQSELKRRLRRPGLFYRWHHPEMSFLEGVMTRGGSELAEVIERAFLLGARFDGWDECFDLSRWRQAFTECGIDAEPLLHARDLNLPLPWEFLQVGPSREFLQRERDRAYELTATLDCAHGPCTGCGICDPKRGLVNRLAACEASAGAAAGEAPSPSAPAGTCYRYRLRVTKLGPAAFLGHLETLDAMRRGLRAAQLPLTYSEGYHPRAKVAAGPALPVGIESEAEYVDVELACEMDPQTLLAAVAGKLPTGMEVREVTSISMKHPSIEASQGCIHYEVDLTTLSGALERAKAVWSRGEAIPVVRERKGKVTEVDARPHIAALAEPRGGVLGLAVHCVTPALKVFEILQALTGISEAQSRAVPIRKTAVEWK